jgi:hypothetical protein
VSIRQFALTAAVPLAVLVTACSSTAAVHHSAASGVTVPGGAGFLHTDPSQVIYLQWPVSQAEVTDGTVKDDFITGDAPNQTITDRTHNFTGQINSNGAVTFDFLGAWGTVYGVKSGDTLTLNLPQEGGGLIATEFRAAVPSDYNAAHASLGKTVDHANQQFQYQQQIGKEEDQLARDFESVSRAPQLLASHLAGLS